MSMIAALGIPGGGEWIPILLIVLLLFGAKRIPEMARSLGRAKKEFGQGLKDAEGEEPKAGDPPAAPPTGNGTSGP